MNELNYQLLDKKIFRSLHVSYAVLISLITIYVIWENSERWLELSFWLPIVELLTVIPLGLMTISAVAMWLILIINIDVIIDMSIKYSIPFSIFSFAVYITVYLMKLGPPTIGNAVIVIFIASIQYGIVMGMGFMA